MIVFKSDPKNPIKEFLQLTLSASKITNSQSPGYLLYISDKWTEKEIRETTLFIKAPKCIKYPAVTLTKQVKGLYD